MTDDSYYSQVVTELQELKRFEKSDEWYVGPYAPLILRAVQCPSRVH
jgi:hypothetical protein